CSNPFQSHRSDRGRRLLQLRGRSQNPGTCECSPPRRSEDRGQPSADRREPNLASAFRPSSSPPGASRSTCPSNIVLRHGLNPFRVCVSCRPIPDGKLFIFPPYFKQVKPTASSVTKNVLMLLIRATAGPGTRLPTE